MFLCLSHGMPTYWKQSQLLGKNHLKLIEFLNSIQALVRKVDAFEMVYISPA